MKDWSQYLEVVAGYYRDVTMAGSQETRVFKVAGDCIALSSSQPRLLENLTRSFEHLRVPHLERPTLSISCWSGKAAGRTPPSPQRWFEERGDSLSVLHQVQTSFAGKSQAPLMGEGDIRCAIHPFPNRLMILEQARGEAYLWQESEVVPPHEQRLPLRELLAWWFARRDIAFVHGAGVGMVEGGVLLVGDSGSGKTSTALSCLRTPLQYAADDYCLVAAEDPINLYGLYSSLQVKKVDDLEQEPRLKNISEENCLKNSGKTVVFMNEVLSEKVTAEFPLKAVVVPTIVDKEKTTYVAVSSAVALAALAPNTLRQMPTMAKATLPLLSKFVSKLPAYRLDLGRDREQIGPAILKLLEGLN